MMLKNVPGPTISLGYAMRIPRQSGRSTAEAARMGGGGRSRQDWLAGAGWNRPRAGGEAGTDDTSRSQREQEPR